VKPAGFLVTPPSVIWKVWPTPYVPEGYVYVAQFPVTCVEAPPTEHDA
jgi:hypothetical protein